MITKTKNDVNNGNRLEKLPKNGQKTNKMTKDCYSGMRKRGNCDSDIQRLENKRFERWEGKIKLDGGKLW